MVRMDARVGARIDAQTRQPYGREARGPWPDKNTTINLRTSGDQCRNAFLIGFDGVCEAVFGARLRKLPSSVALDLHQLEN